jgi:hypothetical protein
MPLPLEHEYRVYLAAKPTLMDKVGQYVLIRGDETIGVWPRYDEALAEGFRRFGMVSFLVQPIARTDPIHSFH